MKSQIRIALTSCTSRIYSYMLLFRKIKLKVKKQSEKLGHA